MAYLVKRLPGAGPNYRLRDLDGVMKLITPEGTVFEKKPAADPYLDVVDLGGNEEPAAKGKAKPAAAKGKAKPAAAKGKAKG